MALFGWKKSKEDEAAPTNGETVTGETNGEDASSGDGGAYQPDPAKARKWFTHARTAADSSNEEYALWCYANGIRFDPEEMAPHEEMYAAAVRYMSKGGKPAPRSEIRKLDGPHPVEHFAAAEFAWMRELRSATAALRVLDAAGKAQLNEFGRWIAPKVVNILRQQKKPSKNDFLKAMKLMGNVAAWDHAIGCGEIALSLDPTDGELQAELKNFAAQRAMDQGGYADTAGEEGGYRKFIRDADKQRELEEGESLSGSSSVEERNLARAKAEYEANPIIPDNINKYAVQLRKQGTPESEELAYKVWMQGYKDTNEYRFRAAAGDIKLARAERKVAQLKQKAEQSPDDPALQETLAKAQADLLAQKAEEFAERVSKYPTDRRLKFQTGEVMYALGRVEDAMANFQAAKEDPKLRVAAGHMLGLCFEKDGWHDVAIGEFKEAMENIDATNRDRELDIRYDLMISLINHARKDQSLDHAKEALEICSSIARKSITYRDIRQRRKEIDALIKELSGEGS